MAVTPPFHVEAIVELTRAGRFSEAKSRIDAHLAKNPRDADALVLAAQLELQQGRLEEAELGIQRALRGGAPQARASLLRAMIAQLRGQTDAALSFAALAGRGPSAAPEVAELVRAEALFAAGRGEEFSKIMSSGARWTSDPNVATLRARAEIALGQLEAAEARLRATFESGAAHVLARRTAGFELVKLLDKSHRHDEAFELATRIHSATTRVFDIDGLAGGLRRSAELAATGALRRAAKATQRTPLLAFIAAVPRSGTTLIEQMLDRHSQLRGIGEVTAVPRLAQAVTARGGWPDALMAITPNELDVLQREYLTLARRALDVPARHVSLDKSLLTWSSLPAIAAALPDSRVIRMTRDPRDTAISLYLSPMHPFTMGWTGALDSIRKVMSVERRIVPKLIADLGMTSVDLVYESLVDDPRAQVTRVLACLGLPFEEPCLAPQENRRAVLTLSQEQVRRPVNRDSIGRWRNYARHFGSEWGEVLALA